MKFNKWFYVMGGFILVKVILLSMLIGFTPNNAVNKISFVEGVELIESKNIKELRIGNNQARLIQNEDVEYSFKVSDAQKSNLLDKSLKSNITTYLEPRSFGSFAAESDLLTYFFQLVFILFLISPPIIALLLFCIWKELKKHNDLK